MPVQRLCCWNERNDMKIKAIANFAHASKRAFTDGKIYEVSDAHAAEFVKAGLAEIIEPPKADEKKPVKKD
jgi:hypothetical protein